MVIRPSPILVDIHGNPCLLWRSSPNVDSNVMFKLEQEWRGFGDAVSGDYWVALSGVAWPRDDGLPWAEGWLHWVNISQPLPRAPQCSRRPTPACATVVASAGTCGWNCQPSLDQGWRAPCFSVCSDDTPTSNLVSTCHTLSAVLRAVALSFPWTGDCPSPWSPWSLTFRASHLHRPLPRPWQESRQCVHMVLGFCKTYPSNTFSLQLIKNTASCSILSADTHSLTHL